MKLIHCFEVPQGREDEFLAGWHKLTAVLQGADGYYSTQLFRQTGDVGKFAFINAAEWRDEDAWRRAVTSDAFRAELGPMADFKGTPGLYEMVYEEVMPSP